MQVHSKSLLKAITVSRIGKYCPLVHHNCAFWWMVLVLCQHHFWRNQLEQSVSHCSVGVFENKPGGICWFWRKNDSFHWGPALLLFWWSDYWNSSSSFCVWNRALEQCFWPDSATSRSGLQRGYIIMHHVFYQLQLESCYQKLCCCPSFLNVEIHLSSEMVSCVLQILSMIHFTPLLTWCISVRPWR